MTENPFKDISIFQPTEQDQVEDNEQEAEDEEILIGDDLDETPDDTAEPITAEQAAVTDIPLPQEASPEETHIASLVCDCCLELNLTSKSVIRCARCENAFCFHFASAIDAQYCVNCMSEMSVTKSIITKTYEHKDEETGRINFYRRRAREIKVEGLDWLFAQRKINALADVELDMAIEYHRNLCSLMIAESERRRNEKMHRYAGVKVSIPTPATTTVTNGVTTTVKKSRTISKNKGAEQVAAILASLQGQGMSIGDILKAIKK
jgi:hypothetical protein